MGLALDLDGREFRPGGEESGLHRYPDRGHYLRLQDWGNREGTAAAEEGGAAYRALARSLQQVRFAGAVVLELPFREGSLCCSLSGPHLRRSREQVQAALRG